MINGARQYIRQCVALGTALLLVVAQPAWSANLSVRVTDPQGRPLANAVVAVRWPDAPPASRDPEPAVMAQQNMTFVPHVLAIPVNTSVLFPNHDQTRHHVYSFSNAKTFDIKLYVGLPERPIVFDEPGVVSLGCNIHDQMQAFIVVSDAPRMAVTDKAGRVLLENVPDLPREIDIWHEWLENDTAPVVRRAAADTTDVSIAIGIAPPPAPPPSSSESMSLQQRFDRIAR